MYCNILAGDVLIVTPALWGYIPIGYLQPWYTSVVKLRMISITSSCLFSSLLHERFSRFLGPLREQTLSLRPPYPGHPVEQAGGLCCSLCLK